MEPMGKQFLRHLGRKDDSESVTGLLSAPGSKVLAASRSARWVCFPGFSPPCQLLLGFRVYRGLELQSLCLLPCLGLSGEVDAKQKLRIVVRCRPCLLATSQGISNSETFDPEPKTAPQPEAS